MASFIADTQGSNLPRNSNDSAARKTSDHGTFQRIVLHAFGLHPVYRDALLLCDMQGFSIAEAAAILDISTSAVIARLARARRQLRARMETEL